MVDGVASSLIILGVVGEANLITGGGFAYKHFELFHIILEVSPAPPATSQGSRLLVLLHPLVFLVLTLEAWRGVRGRPAFLYDGFLGFPPSVPGACRTQSPRMTFTKLATSVSLASWEVKKGCCCGGDRGQVSLNEIRSLFMRVDLHP